MQQQENRSPGYYKQDSGDRSPLPRRIKKEMTLPAALVLSGKVVPRRLGDPAPMYDQQMQDGDEDVYLDMTPKSTPKSSHSNKKSMSRSKSLHGTYTSPRRTASIETSPYKNHFEENDYADMSVKQRSRTATQLASTFSHRSISSKANHFPDRSERAKSTKTLSRNMQLTLKSPGSSMVFFPTEAFSAGKTMPRSPTPNLQTQPISPYLPHSASDPKLSYLAIPSDRFHHSASDIETLNRKRSDGFSQRGRYNTLLSPHRLLSNEPKSSFESEFASPYRQSSVQSQPTTPFKEGGFDKNDDDDYDHVDFGNVSVKIKESRSNRINPKEKSRTLRPNHRPTTAWLSLPKSPDLLLKQPIRSRQPSNDSNNNSTCEFTLVQEKNHENAKPSILVENEPFRAFPDLEKAPDEAKCLQTKDQLEASKALTSARSYSADISGRSTSCEVQSMIRFQDNQSFNCYRSIDDAGLKKEGEQITEPGAATTYCHSQEIMPMNEKQSIPHMQHIRSLGDTEKYASELVKSPSDSRKCQEDDEDFVDDTKISTRVSRHGSTSSITLDSERSIEPKTNKKEKKFKESKPQHVSKKKSTTVEAATEIQSEELQQPQKKKKSKSSFWRRKKNVTTDKKSLENRRKSSTDKKALEKPRKSISSESKVKRFGRSLKIKRSKKKSIKQSNTDPENELHTEQVKDNSYENEVSKETELNKEHQVRHSSADECSDGNNKYGIKPDKCNDSIECSSKSPTVVSPSKSRSFSEQFQTVERIPVRSPSAASLPEIITMPGSERLEGVLELDQSITSKPASPSKEHKQREVQDVKKTAKTSDKTAQSAIIQAGLSHLPLLDISLPSNYDDNEESDEKEQQTPIRKDRDGSWKGKTLGKLLTLRKSSPRLQSLQSIDDALSDVSAYDYQNIDVKEEPFTQEEGIFSTKHYLMFPCATESRMLTHGFMIQNAVQSPVVAKKVSLIGKMKSRTISKISVDSDKLKTNRLKSLDFDEVDHTNDHSQSRTKSLSNVLDENTENKNVREDEAVLSEPKLFPRNNSAPSELLNMETFSLPRTKQKIYPIYQKPSSRSLDVARLLLHLIKTTQHELIVGSEEIEDGNQSIYIGSDGYQPEIDVLLRRSYAKGQDLVTWMQDLLRVKQKFDEKEDRRYKATITPSRHQVVGMWQVLFEEGAIFHVKYEEQFEDADYYYGFHENVTSPKSSNTKLAQTLDKNEENFAYNTVQKEVSQPVKVMLNSMSRWIEEMELSEALTYLSQHYHDALFRKALRERPDKRTSAELVMIYEEILRIKALGHLSDAVKRELAGVLKFEFHSTPGTTIFRQGDEGTSWYIILHGSVKVDVLGKGVVCVLKEGDDFGDLALVNDAPRSASIVVAEPNCHFVKVDKVDFIRILQDVEANTVRLKEHGEDMLILEKIRCPVRTPTDKTDSLSPTEHSNGSTRQSYRFSVTAGTPQGILEHILEYLQPWKVTAYDETLEDFILTYIVFMKSEVMFDVLLKNYRSEDAVAVPFQKSMKRRVVYFVLRWSHIITYLRDGDRETEEFLQELEDEIQFDCSENPDYVELKTEFSKLYQFKKRAESLANNNGESSSNSYLIVEETVKRFQNAASDNELQRPIRETDDVLMKIYNRDKEYTTVKMPLSSTAEEILQAVSEKTKKPHDNLNLFEIQENGDVITIRKHQRSVVTSVALNSFLSIGEESEMNSLHKPETATVLIDPRHLESVSSLEVAYHINQYDWQLVNNVHVMEYIYRIFGVQKFEKSTPNLDMLGRRFNQLAYWPPTEICSCTNLNKRALALRKFIKIAQHLKSSQNMNAFMAIMIGIGNQAISRLTATWEKLPTKYKKLVQEFEAILDPSRNNRTYRVLASSLEPPFIPYFPLLMKDMTFQHEGNDNKKQKLVNFEKLHLISSSIKTILRGCSENFENHFITSSKTSSETRTYVKTFKVITDQKVLNELSAQIEPKR